jgi:hypothetical protein
MRLYPDRGEEWAANRDGSLSPEGIAKVGSYDTPSDAVLTTLFHSRTSTLLIRTALPGPGSSIVVSLHCQCFCSAEA